MARLMPHLRRFYTSNLQFIPLRMLAETLDVLSQCCEQSKLCLTIQGIWTTEKTFEQRLSLMRTTFSLEWARIDRALADCQRVHVD
jgi:hypothetical protein